MQNDGQLTVALLISDMNAVREISRVFKQAGVTPYFYETLKEYWNGIIHDVPSLSVVDVKMMSDGELFLAAHPFVQNDELPLVFYYTDETQALMKQAFDCLSLGFIKNELGYSDQIKALLKRVNHFYKLDRENETLKALTKDVDTKVERVVMANQRFQEMNHYNDLLYRMSEDFEKSRNDESFISSIERVFSKYDEIEQYTCFELSANGKKLVGLEGSSDKYFSIPSLWLGQLCKNGIEGFAQNLASQVAFDLMGENLICLNIMGMKKNPDMLMFIQCEDEQMLNHFNWDLFERYLSGVCEHHKLKENPRNLSKGIFLNPWELMSTLDSHAFGKLPGDKVLPSNLLKGDVALMNIDFSDLIDYIRSQKNVRFYWKEFHADFVARLDHLQIDSLRIVSMGVQNMGLLVNENYSEDAFKLVKGLIGRYPFWRFFEETDLVLVQSLKPMLRMSPISSKAYFQLMDGLEFTMANQMIAEEKKEKTKQIIWGDAPDLTI
ncbi:hypothetical protein HBN50_12645 [Halobacteriovorax sp. GB3]|uniref:hypothetical protein n=1 Tax=Halobacteriovorax sp. GB3 TaxID=2719615 RepID=UPI0023601D34|nr:hypothetical protein [Halobacteriovorax sp. GB3]MDD0853953.1 hypothetical protein [Halobacteriovorax sp. GB3]